MLMPWGRATAGRGMMMPLFSVIPSVRVFSFSTAHAFGLCLSGIASADLPINVK
jgi:hypothetical protein